MCPRTHPSRVYSGWDGLQQHQWPWLKTTCQWLEEWKDGWMDETSLCLHSWGSYSSFTADSGSTKQTQLCGTNLNRTLRWKCSFPQSSLILRPFHDFLIGLPHLTFVYIQAQRRDHVHQATQTATQSWHNDSHIAAIFCSFFFCLLAYDAALSHLLTLQVCAHWSHIRHQISDRASCSISLTSSSTDFLIPASDGRSTFKQLTNSLLCRHKRTLSV